MIIATWHTHPVAVLAIKDGRAEIITLDDSRLFALESSSQARKYGAPPIAYSSDGFVDVGDLEKIHCTHEHNHIETDCASQPWMNVERLICSDCGKEF